MTEKQIKTLEQLKTRQTKLVDWKDMMKEVERGRKLRHVECNDRSKPVLTADSTTLNDEKKDDDPDSSHHELLKQIQGGIKLRSVKTNDRSKPILGGLRKFKKQMTIEEQIQKSESRAQLGQVPDEEPAPESGDEMEDIDRLRDDLQSTKQMLSLELRNKEAQERENKRLLAKIAQLEAEVAGGAKTDSTDKKSNDKAASGASDAVVKALKQQVEDAEKHAKEMEKKYQEMAEQLDAAKGAVEKQKASIATLEKKLSVTQVI